MFRFQNMLRFFVLSTLMSVAGFAAAQFVPKVVNYLPAPGQYTNADFIGTPSAANSIVGTNKGIVSLGAFGGSVTVYFPDGIKNDPANPYGVDFTIYGNATTNWSEPGIVQVMKDENGNGLPDDTWYEIAGSDHFWKSTISDYQVTYQNSGLNQASNIQWTDNQGASGIIPENSFHQQTYYPRADLFPGVPTDKYTLKGTRISGQIDLSNPGVVNSYHRAFGYADNTPVLSWTEKLPDNPYTPEIEGSGGDAIDIGWAVDANKKPVNLDVIHFIRIYTGMNAVAGWLGEISTEVTGIRVVEPAAVTGTTSTIVIRDLPSKIWLGENLSLEALVFEKGIRQENTPVVWSVSDPDLAQISNGELKALKNGNFKLRASSSSNPAIYAELELEIFSNGKAQISLHSTSLKVNDKLELSGKLTDGSGNLLSGMTPVWKVENEHVAELIQQDGTFFLKGKETGQTWLVFEAAELPSIRDSVLISVFPESPLKKVYVSVKTSEKTLIPRHAVWVSQTDLTASVDRTQKLYGMQQIPFVSLAHAIAAEFNNSGFSGQWNFRDDAEGGSALYLWKVPEMDGGSTVYTFGYGGSRTSDTYRKTWVVLLNQQSYVSGFDTVKVNNNDEILIYHITDNNLPWTVTQLTSQADSVQLNQPVNILLRQYSCSMDNNRKVSVISSEVLAGQTVQVTPQNQSNPDISVKTDEFGKASFSVSQSGDYLIISGIDEAGLVAEPITGASYSLKNRQGCRVFPNPFSGIIRIKYPQSIDLVEILNGVGQLVFSKIHPGNVLDLSFLPKGFYVLRTTSVNEVFQQKIVRQ